jgi:hypothetical protein
VCVVVVDNRETHTLIINSKFNNNYNFILLIYLLCFALENFVFWQRKYPTKKSDRIEDEGVCSMGGERERERGGRQEKTEEIIINNNDFSLSLITFFFLQRKQGTKKLL